MTEEASPPSKDEFELTLFGPGYGESIVLHVGDGVWVIVDSCIDRNNAPSALRYLNDIGLDPAQAVKCIVATHWHDDHIRGMAQLVESCGEATFCCSAALCQEEFLFAMDALDGHRRLTNPGSGVRELHNVYEQLTHIDSKPEHAIANRRIFRSNACEIWSLSPSDRALQRSQQTISSLIPNAGDPQTRIRDLSPNEAAVALWVKVGDIVVLLGSDLEKQGWTEILQSRSRPDGMASVFKIPHHGSRNADVPGVWRRILEKDPFSVLAPWHQAGRVLPSQEDIDRILSNTENAYASTRKNSISGTTKNRNSKIDKIVRKSDIKLRQTVMSSGAVRLRRPIEGGTPASWKVDLFGPACRLQDFI